MGQAIKKIYLHWTATDYNWQEPGHYHTVILGNGAVRRLTGYDQPLGRHTSARNSESVALAIACMGGQGWDDFPPTAIQIENLCKEVAQVASQLGWKPEEITVARVMTHAEAAANRDFPLETVRKVSGLKPPSSTPQADEYLKRARSLGLPHENYGPAEWMDQWPGGFGERWDLWQVKPSDQPGAGGVLLREKIKHYLAQMTTPSSSFSTASQIKIYLNDKLVTTGILLTDERCYAKVSELAATYGMNAIWNNKSHYVNLINQPLKPKFLADTPLIAGYPAIDIYMNRPVDVNGESIDDPKLVSRPFMQGLLINNSVYALLADFCQEFGISVSWRNSDRSLHLGKI